MIVLWVEMPSVPCRLSFFLGLLKQILRTNARQVICCIKRPTCIKRSPRHSPCVTAYYRFNCIFATYEKKCLRTARRLLRGMLTFGIVLLYDLMKKKKKHVPPLLTTTKRFLILNEILNEDLSQWMEGLKIGEHITIASIWRKIWTGICPRTLSVPRCEQFSESEAWEKLWASRIR